MLFKSCSLLQALTLVILGCGCACSATIRVPSEQPTIQAGVDAASVGDTVLVADGTYMGPENRNIDYRGKDISVLSENGPGKTVINIQKAGRGFNFHSSESNAALLAGFTIMNGEAEEGIEEAGAGIRCHNSSPTIANCLIRDNYSEEVGGGISCGAYSIITDCIISENSAGYSAGAGGGVHCFENSIIADCDISDNTTDGDYGSSAGGIQCGHNTIIVNCNITENRTIGYFSHGKGGGIWMCGSATAENCIIARNYARGWGGGIYENSGSDAIVLNCTITENSAGEDGGGICGSPIVTNCIIWANSPDAIAGSPTVSYSNIQCGSKGEGNIDEDPLFTLVPWFGFVYGLRTASPCIDAGDPSIDDAVFDSNPRCPPWYINGSRSDMGAYGGPGNAGWLD